MTQKNNRIQNHPVLSVERGQPLNFSFDGELYTGYQNETIAAALIANGIEIFQYHHKDHAPQGIFCANGQCSQCMVLVNGFPRKACMEMLQEGMHIQPLDGLYHLPVDTGNSQLYPIIQKKVKVLIVGAGPAGLSAAIELGSHGIETLLIDDKNKAGGKLVLQTHRFFGSKELVYAGTRGIDIAKILAEQSQEKESVEVWLNSPMVGVFSDHKAGVFKDNRQYALIDPEILVIATGARERSLPFPGNTLPGIIGAGAFQTLLNRDLVLPGENFFVIGGGNVGLIAAYHALQAGIHIAGLAEILPQCGGYKVHLDKIKRLGVPIHTSHTILRANGSDHVESVTIARVDEHFEPILDSAQTIACDGVLIAAGLTPVNEFFQQAQQFGFHTFASGDAQEIAEASAAIVSGQIIAKRIVSELDHSRAETLTIQNLENVKKVLSSKPGNIQISERKSKREGVLPVFHCAQEIPCNPCSGLCVHHLISIPADNIMAVPDFVDPDGKCVGCAQCVIGCPGLAVTLVDYRKDPFFPFVTIPYELPVDKSDIVGHSFPVTDRDGRIIGVAEVVDLSQTTKMNHTSLIKVIAPAEIAEQVAGIRFEPEKPIHIPEFSTFPIENETIICRCERVSAQDIRTLIRNGIHDLNLLKAITRAGMGACGGKTCEPLILQIMKEEGVPPQDVIPFSKRPLTIEIPVHAFLEPEQNGDEIHE